MKVAIYHLVCYFSIITTSFYNTTAQVQSDLRDYRYKGPVKSVTVHYYVEPVMVNKKWLAADSLQPHTILTRYFNKEGNLTKVDLRARYNKDITDYTYVNGIKTGWVTTDSTGKEFEKAGVVQYLPDSITETSINTRNKERNIDVTIFNKELLARANHCSSYDKTGEVVYNRMHTYTDDKQGHIVISTAKDLVKNTTEVHEFEMLELDRYSNPVLMLTKLNGKINGIRKIVIEYE